MIRRDSEFNIRMGIGSSLTLLTLLAIGTLADQGEFTGVDNPQDLGIEVQNLNAAETQNQVPLPSLWELKNELNSLSQISPREVKIERLGLRPAISLSPEASGSQPETEPQYILTPTTEESGGSPSTRLSAHVLSVNQSQPKPPIWIIRVPPRQSPLYLALVPQNHNPALYNFTQLLGDGQKPKPQNLGEDRLIQSLYNLSKIESEIQTMAVQINELQNASQTISNVDNLAQLREEPSLLESLLQNLTKNLTDPEYISQPQFNLQNETVDSNDQPHIVPSYSGSQTQYQNQTVYDLVQTNGSQSQLQNQTVNNLELSHESQSETQLQNQTVNSLDQSHSQSGSELESQNQTVHNSVKSYVSISQSQLQNQTVNNIQQLQNQTVSSVDQLNNFLSHFGSQSQSQNQTIIQSYGSQSQVQNQTVNNLEQSQGSQSQFQLQNQTLNSLDPSHSVPSQSGSQSQIQNQTIVQSYVTLSQLQLQNQTLHNLVQLNDSQSQAQSPNQTQINTVQSDSSPSQFQLPNQTVNDPDQSHNVLPQPGSQSDSQNHTIISSADFLPQSQFHNQSSIVVTINASLHIIKSIKYVIERPPPFFTLSDIKDDANLQTFDLIEKYGYPSETRYIYTEDGYKLCMHRIPRPGAPSVLLVHGLMSSSVSWVQLGPNSGLAYILYRKGYDVWMLNTRGNVYSREHKKENIKPRDYWDFSFHEIGKFDLPPAIDLILKITQQPKIQYIGHSQGSTVFFVMCSERPEYAAKVNLMQALAPTVYLRDTLSPVLKFLGMFKGKFSMLVNLLGGYEISSKTRLIKQFRDHICSTSELASRICTIFDFVLCGFDWKSFNDTLTPIVAAHASQGASAKQIYHYAQMQGKHNFQLFDHGRVLNRIRYNENEPPMYNLSLAATKVVIHHSSGDWLGVDSDVAHLVNRLPNVLESRKVQVGGFAHFDFTISKNVRPLVYDSVLGHLENNP